MLTGMLPIDSGKGVHCMSTVQSSGFFDNEVLNNVIFENSLSGGDGLSAELVKVAVINNKEIGEAASFQDEFTATERFVSVLDKRRLKRQLEEASYEYKLSLKRDTEAVSIQIDSLIGKLRRQFSEEKQERADTIKPSYSQYIFSNSVDAFLRYHEKPKIDIRYISADGYLQGEGLYSFAVRPTRIKKTRTDTYQNPQYNVNVATVSPNTVVGTGLEDSDGDGFKNLALFNNKVYPMQNTKASADVFTNKYTGICHTPSGLTVSPISRCIFPGNINRHVILPTDTIRKSERDDSLVLSPTNKMLIFEELFPIINEIATSTNPYFRAVVPIHKVQAYRRAYGTAIPSLLEYHVSDRNNNIGIPAYQTTTIGHAIPAMVPYHSLDKNGYNVIPAFHKVTTGHGILSMCDYHRTDKSANYVILPFQKITLRVKIKSAVHIIDLLVHMIHTERRKCFSSKPSLYKRSTAGETCDHTTRLKHNVSVEKELYAHSVMANNRLKILGVYNTIHLTGVSQNTSADEAGARTVYIMPGLKQLSLMRIKIIYGHNLPPAKGPKSCAATQLHGMTLALGVFKQPVRQSYQVFGYTCIYKERCDKIVSSVSRAALQNIPDKTITPIFKTLVLKEDGQRIPLIYKPASGKVSDHEKVPVNDGSTFGGVSDSTEAKDNNCRAVKEADETIHDTIIDEDNDDSPFGIMSIYCNSEIHSSFCRILEDGK